MYEHNRITIGDYEIRILHDEYAESPRESWDNLGKMLCRKHSNYNLGDKHNYPFDLHDSWEEMEEALKKTENACIVLPLYLYDHSGLTIKTTPFSCQWDSGRIGVIYAKKEDVYKEYGVKRITKDIVEKVTNLLEGEVETYDQYLRGDVYLYEIYKEGELVDSCSGFYGEDYCLEEATSMVEYYMKKEKVSVPS